MIFFLACYLIAAGCIALPIAAHKYPAVRCAIEGHLPKCSIVGYDMRRHCVRCEKEVGPL